MTKDSLDELIGKVDLSEKTEMGEVVKEFSENRPSASNLTPDEHVLTWRAKGIYHKYPQTLKIIEQFIDSKRSVGGWNTLQKVAAITGIQQQRQGVMGKFMDKMFSPRQP